MTDAGWFAEGREEHAVLAVDSHVHFWDPARLSYPWLAESAELNRPFGPADFAGAVPEPVEAIFVEAGRLENQSAREVEWVRELAVTAPWIRGAVAHVPLDGPDRGREAIRACAADSFVVGVRHNVQDELPGFMRGAAFRAGLGMLGEAGLPFDACIRQHQMAELAEVVEACPQTLIVLDHLGKPLSAPPDADWRDALRRLARCENTVCKLSGLATEVGSGARRQDVLAVLREALDAFGPERCLYGGDWPVMTLATDYRRWLGLVREALDGLAERDVEAVLRTNAMRVYRLDPRSETASEAVAEGYRSEESA